MLYSSHGFIYVFHLVALRESLHARETQTFGPEHNCSMVNGIGPQGLQSSKWFALDVYSIEFSMIFYFVIKRVIH